MKKPDPSGDEQLAEASAALDDLVAPDPDKSLAQRIRDEFADFKMLVDHCSRIYYHVTNGQISKPQTLPQVVISIADDLETERTEQAIAEAREEWEAEAAAARLAGSPEEPNHGHGIMEREENAEDADRVDGAIGKQSDQHGGSAATARDPEVAPGDGRAHDAERDYWCHALDLVADTLRTLKSEEFDARRDKAIAIILNAAYRLRAGDGRAARLHKAASDAFVILEGLRLAVDWELAPPIKKEIARVAAELARTLGGQPEGQ